MADSFDTVVLIKKMREKRTGEDFFIEKSNGKRVIIHPNEEVIATEGFVVVIKDKRDIAIDSNHIISIINKGDL